MKTLYIFLGGPGSGKGTQAGLLSKHLNIPHVSTGELFRKHMSEKTEIGLKIEKVYESGDLVDDATVMQMVNLRLTEKDCENGVILDGVPRTITQADLLETSKTNLGIDDTSVIYIHVDEHEMLERLSARWTCKKCGRTYNTKFKPPKKEKTCDVDGTMLYQRHEDSPETQKIRIAVYHEKTEPLVAYYKAKENFIEINGNGDINTIFEEIKNKLNI